MATSTRTKEIPESPSLFNYLRQEIPLEELRDYASPKRIKSIDFVKGFAIIFIILAHTADWLNAEWYFLYGLLFALLDFLGPSLFVFLSALSVIFTIKKKEGIIPNRLIRNGIFTRGIIITLIGIIINRYYVNPVTGELELVIWGWHIFVFLGLAQIFSYYALKLKKWIRVVIGVTIIIISPPIREIVYLGTDAGNPVAYIFHLIITSNTPDLTLLPWISICFLSTIFGEYLYEAMMKDTADAYTGLFRLFLVWGIILVSVGIIIGFPLQIPETLPGGAQEYPHIKLLAIANQQDFFHIAGYPLFLIRHTSANMFYNLGMALLIIAISFYFIDIRKKKGLAVNMLVYYGKISLSLFLLHLLFLPLYLAFLDVTLFLFVSFAYIGLLGVTMYIWMEFGKGIGSPEWIMVEIGRVGHRTGESVRKVARKKIEAYFTKDE